MLLIFRNFELQGMITAFTSLEWIRSYNLKGEFTLTIPFTKENFKLLETGNIIFRKDTKEACIIYNHKIISTETGGERLIVTGYSLVDILSYRIFTYKGTGDFKTIANKLITEAIINPSDSKRKIEGFQVKDYVINKYSVSMDYTKSNLYTALSSAALIHNVGLKVDYNYSDRTYDFSMYEGSDSEAVFTPLYNNILTQDYYRQTSDYKNVCYINRDEEEDIYNNNISGLDRREIYLQSNTGIEGTLKEQAREYLEQYKITESFDTVISPDSIQYPYRIDWDLGDTVVCLNTEWGINVRARVSEIIEYFDLDGFHLNVNFGDYLPNVSKVINS